MSFLRRKKVLLHEAEHCDWDKLEGKDWTELLEAQPQFADKCPWEKLSRKDWEHLLQKQPQFASKRLHIIVKTILVVLLIICLTVLAVPYSFGFAAGLFNSLFAGRVVASLVGFIGFYAILKTIIRRFV